MFKSKRFSFLVSFVYLFIFIKILLYPTPFHFVYFISFGEILQGCKGKNKVSVSLLLKWNFFHYYWRDLFLDHYWGDILSLRRNLCDFGSPCEYIFLYYTVCGWEVVLRASSGSADVWRRHKMYIKRGKWKIRVTVPLHQLLSVTECRLHSTSILFGGQSYIFQMLNLNNAPLFIQSEHLIYTKPQYVPDDTL